MKKVEPAMLCSRVPKIKRNKIIRIARKKGISLRELINTWVDREIAESK